MVEDLGIPITSKRKVEEVDPVPDPVPQPDVDQDPGCVMFDKMSELCAVIGVIPEKD